MVLTHEKVFGYKKGEGPQGPSPFDNVADELKQMPTADLLEKRGEKMNEAKFKSSIDGLVLDGVRYMKGQAIKANLDDKRAASLMTAGFIEENVVAPVEPEEKAVESAPVDKQVKGPEVKKGAEGKGADLLKKKKK